MGDRQSAFFGAARTNPSVSHVSKGTSSSLIRRTFSLKDMKELMHLLLDCSGQTGFSYLLTDSVFNFLVVTHTRRSHCHQEMLTSSHILFFMRRLVWIISPFFMWWREVMMYAGYRWGRRNETSVIASRVGGWSLVLLGETELGGQLGLLQLLWSTYTKV